MWDHQQARAKQTKEKHLEYPAISGQSPGKGKHNRDQ